MAKDVLVFLDSVEFDLRHSRKPEIDGEFTLHYVGLFPAKISGFRYFFPAENGQFQHPHILILQIYCYNY
jgi:hypothetical protein